MKRVVLFLLAVLSARAAPGALPAFPGAEGFGATTPGGRGGRVIAVTSLDDDGPGSLRQALREKGPRIIVFRVGGVITLKKDLQLDEPFVTIAGQSAPGDGICLSGAGLRINTHDVIVRFLRVRVGDDSAGPNPENRDAIGIASRAAPPHHVILDHCSASWAIDENIQLWYPCHDITVQWCLIGESLENSLHPKGRHGMGLLIGDHARNISVHHNLFAHNMDRNPLLKGDTATEVLNNVAYNWRSTGAALGDPEGSGQHRADLIGNLYLPGPQSPARAAIIVQPTVKAGSAVYVRDNAGPGRETGSGDEWSAVQDRREAKVRTETRVLPGERIRLTPASELRDLVLAEAGATRPRRDAIDARLIQSVRARSGGLINSPRDVGGLPTYRGAEAPVDSDLDGMPDDWERQHGLDPRNAADGARTAPDGYTWVEEYLNGLAASPLTAAP